MKYIIWLSSEIVPLFMIFHDIDHRYPWLREFNVIPARIVISFIIKNPDSSSSDVSMLVKRTFVLKYHEYYCCYREK